MYAYGDQAYAMYEKAPENINVTFPVINGVIADYANMQTMIFEFLEKYSKGKVRGAEFVVAVPTDITEVEKKAFFDIFAKSKVKPKGVLLCEKPLADRCHGCGYRSRYNRDFRHVIRRTGTERPASFWRKPD